MRAALAICALGALPSLELLAASAGTLEDVKARGVLRCGVAPNSPGFAFKDAQGNYRGFDVDFCHAIAAAVFGDAKKIELSPLGLRDGFATLASGGVDVLTHRFTWTFNRDNGTGIETVADGVLRRAGLYRSQVGQPEEREGPERRDNLRRAGHHHRAQYCRLFPRSRHEISKAATFADLDEARNAYEAGRCDAWTNDRGSLAARSQGLKNRADHVMLPDTISKEPIGPMVKNGDDAWFHVVRWTIAAVVAAEELGVTSQNVDQSGRRAMPSRRSSGCSASATILARSLVYRRTGPITPSSRSAITARFSSAMLARRRRSASRAEPNAQWTEGGLLQAPPFR